MDYMEELSWVVGQLGGVEDTILQYLKAVLLLGSGFGLLNCFFGFKLRKIWAVMLGFLLGGGIVGGIGTLFIKDTKVTIILAIVVGIILAVLLFYLYRGSLFLICSAMVYLILKITIPTPNLAMQWLSVGAGLLVGLLVLKFEKSIVIWTTGIFGGVLAGKLLTVMIERDDLKTVMVVASILTLTGVLFQYLTTRKYGNKWDDIEDEGNEQYGNHKKEKTVFQNMYDSLTGRDEDEDEEYEPPIKEFPKKAVLKENIAASDNWVDIDIINEQISRDIKEIYKEDVRR